MLTWLSGGDDTHHPPTLLKLRSSKPFIMTTVALAIFTDLFTYAVIIPVLPFALESRVHINAADTQRWISIFLAVYGGSLLCSAPIVGWMADRLSSRRGPMLFGLVVMMGSTGMLCGGRSIAVLMVGRVLQGVSGAVVWGVGLALLVDTMGTEEIGLAMGYVGLGMSLATLVAPLVGGVVFAKVGYFAVYAVAFGLMGLDVVLRVLMVERKVAKKWISDTGASGNDVTAVGNKIVEKQTSSGTIDTYTAEDKKQVHQSVSEVSEQDVYNELPPLINSASVSQEGRRGPSRVPATIRLLGSRRLLSALWCCIASTIVYTTMDAVLPLFVKDTFEWNSLGAGLIFLPLTLPSFLNPVIGHLCDRYGPRWLATAGSVMACPCLILLRLVNHNSLEQKVLLCGLLTILGISLNLVMTPMMAEISYVVEAKARSKPEGYYGKHGAYAQGYSLFNIGWSAGGMIGPLLGGLTNESKGWPTVTLLLGCTSILTAIPAVIWTGGSILKKKACPDGQRRIV